MIKYVTKTKKELSKIVYEGNSLPVLKVNKENNSFINFHYFSFRDLNNMWHNPIFIVAFNDTEKAENILGVLEYDIYGEEPMKYIGVSFIDVRTDFKQKGIATEMIKYLNENLTEKDILVNSRLSEEGKIAKINDVFHKYVTKCPFFEKSEDLTLEKLQKLKNKAMFKNSVDF